MDPRNVFSRPVSEGFVEMVSILFTLVRGMDIYATATSSVTTCVDPSSRGGLVASLYPWLDTYSAACPFRHRELRRMPLRRSSRRRERGHSPAPVGPGPPAAVLPSIVFLMYGFSTLVAVAYIRNTAA